MKLRRLNRYVVVLCLSSRGVASADVRSESSISVKRQQAGRRLRAVRMISGDHCGTPLYITIRRRRVDRRKLRRCASKQTIRELSYFSCQNSNACMIAIISVIAAMFEYISADLPWDPKPRISALLFYLSPLPFPYLRLLKLRLIPILLHIVPWPPRLILSLPMMSPRPDIRLIHSSPRWRAHNTSADFVEMN